MAAKFRFADDANVGLLLFEIGIELTPTLIHAYHRAWQKHLDDLQAYCAKYNIGYVRTPVEEPFEVGGGILALAATAGFLILNKGCNRPHEEIVRENARFPDAQFSSRPALLSSNSNCQGPFSVCQSARSNCG